MSFKTMARIALAVMGVWGAGHVLAEVKLLNVSYDVSRELYKEINPAFAEEWKRSKNQVVTINQSHGGSSAQAQAVLAGLEADVVTMNQPPDIDALVSKKLVASDWRTQFPHDAAPYTTITVFLVRKGNPKKLNDWDDLTRPGLQVIVPNPKTSGNGRYTYLAAWGYALEKTGSEQGARDFVKKLFVNVPVLDGGGRGATTTFTQRAIGDVLVTFENEARLIASELGTDQFDVVYPSLSIEAAAPIAIVDSVAKKHGTVEAANAYLNFLYTPTAQDIIAHHHFRPRDPATQKKYANQYPVVKTFTVEERLGGWDAVKKNHFADGALFDQITGAH
ncbi:MAG TPA: sulfate ABC transporter substrate-binding protein [Dongiaceae bacterium]|nr:sulfate ABC transporter substrate-binding protein [Dongiaceae bacterium]